MVLNNIVNSVRVFLSKNQKMALSLEYELNDNLSEAYLELIRTLWWRFFVKIVNS